MRLFLISILVLAMIGLATSRAAAFSSSEIILKTKGISQPAFDFPLDKEDTAGNWWSISGGDNVAEETSYTTGSDPSEEKRGRHSYYLGFTAPRTIIRNKIFLTKKIRKIIKKLRNKRKIIY